jgi:transcriptional regulator with GAF, ATPase, and Fis domain
LTSAINDKKEYRCVYRIVWPDGTIRWIEGGGAPVYDEHGECVRVMGVNVDVTERKRGEEELRAALEEVHRLKAQIEAENVYLREEVSEVHRFGEIIGESSEVRKILQQVAQVAGSDTTVLITGETGTGKELVARAIHAQSARRDRPLVKVNCAALPAELIESELFGHEKGAFTGATAKRVGRFELADGATIFLDEIGDLPLELQAKLLRVLQEGEFERVGNARTLKVNVRVIAATNRNLAEALQSETFRSDLYYRLAVYPIAIPPLRERKQDIKLLAATFLGEANRRLGRSFSSLPQGILTLLEEYHWPGNIRELQNVIERAVLLSTGRALRLPEEWRLMSARQGAAGTPAEEGAGEWELQRVTLEQLERRHVMRVLKETHWRIEGHHGAALILGVHPSTLRSRMHKLGIRR